MTILEPHLDIDQLSAAVDDAGDPTVAAHMLVCLACRKQVDTWAGALALLRSQPTPPPDVDPVIVAMAAWTSPPEGAQNPSEGAQFQVEAALAEPVEAEAGTAPADAADVEAVPAHPVEGDAPLPASAPPPARPGAAAAAPVEAGRRHRLRRLRPRAGVAAALVAVVLVAAAVVGIRAAGSGSSSGSSQTASRAAAPAKGASSPSTLATGLTAPNAAPSATSGVPAATSPRAGAVSESPSFAGTAQLAADLRQVVPAQPAAAVRSDTPCLPQARADAGEIPAVTSTAPSYTETVTLVGVPGRVFVFALTHGQVAVVVRSSTCSLLATVQF